jgi:periplasmic divalent cation tolerance protein
MIYLFWTCKNEEEATTIIHALLERRLIACASLWPEVVSIYRWQGKIEVAREVKVVFKTEKRCFDAICETIVRDGSYEAPEVVAVDIVRCNPRYREWVEQEIAMSRT